MRPASSSPAEDTGPQIERCAAGDRPRGLSPDSIIVSTVKSEDEWILDMRGEADLISEFRPSTLHFLH